VLPEKDAFIESWENLNHQEPRNLKHRIL